jgi:hypothetical protein
VGSREPQGAEVDPAASVILRNYFGPSWRAWRWLREQFSVTSIAALVSVLGILGGYVVHLRQDVAVVRERVVVLETRVVPVLSDRTDVAVLQTRVEDHEQRITRIEADWIDAKAAAGTPPTARRRR